MAPVDIVEESFPPPLLIFDECSGGRCTIMERLFPEGRMRIAAPTVSLAALLSLLDEIADSPLSKK